MPVYRFNATKEIEKISKGRKSKMADVFGVGLVVYEALRDYPGIQKKLGKAFGIYTR